MSNCSSCKMHLLPSQVYRREVHKDSKMGLNFIKQLFLVEIKHEKKIMCQLCAKRIDRIYYQNKCLEEIIHLTLVIIIFTWVPHLLLS